MFAYFCLNAIYLIQEVRIIIQWLLSITILLIYNDIHPPRMKTFNVFLQISLNLDFLRKKNIMNQFDILRTA